MTKQFINSLALVCAISTPALSHANPEMVKKALLAAMPGISITAINPSEIKGVYEVAADGSLFYVSEDAKYILQGHLIDIKAKKDLTETKLATLRVQDLEAMGEKNMIIFKPKVSKYKVSIFTDIDCGYCRKLHSEMEQYLAEGITVRYLFYPRAGKGSDSYNKAVSVWCAKDRNAALTNAKQGKDPEPKKCTNPIDAQMALGVKFGAQGTPMIITEKGTILPGYVPAKQLAQALAGGE